MKKISLLTATVLCIGTINNNITARQRISEANTLGQQVIRELGENVKSANLVFRSAVGEIERQEALKNAHMTAQTLLNTLNDIKTYGSETIKGYNAAQRRQAAINLAELLTRANSINIEIENKRMEKMDMTEDTIFESVKPGKSEAYAQATKDLRDLITEEKSTRLAMKNQEAILGQDWSNAIKLAIQNLIVGNSYGIAYGIDWYFGDRGAKLMVEKDRSTSMVPAAAAPRAKKTMPLTQKQKSAIKSWNKLRKNELLSKEITTAYQLTQAKELLNNLNMVKDDLRNVPLKHKYILDRVTEKSDSLSRKIERSKTRWLK
jgi:hypothetical protein